jgi:hypothetical protein
MTYRKGERTDRRREAEFPFAVDIPIPRDGLGQNLNRILAAAQAYPGGAECWSHSTKAGAMEIRQWWSRTGFKKPAEADRFAAMFAELGARRAR